MQTYSNLLSSLVIGVRARSGKRALLCAGLLGLLALLSPAAALGDESGQAAHNELFDQNRFPSATQCSTCHPQQFREWAASPHAYAQLSPVFNAMHATLVKQTNGTMGDFCIRCHTPVGMELGEPIIQPNADRHAISREGVTCVSCHRRIVPSGKNSSRNGLIAGNIFAPIYGPVGNAELRRVIESGEYDVNADPEKDGRNIHADAVKNDQLTTPGFCGNCHDVNGANGFRLEEAFSDFKTSPAAAKGISCQDCHMSKEQGRPSGYDFGPAALVGGKPTRPRKHANHRFIGPDYSIVHPGLFPHNPEADKFATLSEWVTFDFKAGWGTADFEDEVSDDAQFPERWRSAVDRFEARRLIENNQELLSEAAEQRKQLLQIGYTLGDLKITNLSPDEIAFDITVNNGIDGHSVPTGFDAERLVFLRVNVTDQKGAVVFQSGDLDPNGDLRDELSAYVHSGKLGIDEYLFNLQSKFLVELIRGSERDQVLNINYSTSPLPFIRPPTNAASLVGRAVGTRKHRQVIPPLDSRTASYRIGSENLAGHSGPFCVRVELVAGMIPVNLVSAIQSVGFDYQMSPRNVADAVVAGHQVLWKRSRLLNPEGSASDSPEECPHD